MAFSVCPSGEEMQGPGFQLSVRSCLSAREGCRLCGKVNKPLLPSHGTTPLLENDCVHSDEESPSGPEDEPFHPRPGQQKQTFLNWNR